MQWAMSYMCFLQDDGTFQSVRWASLIKLDLMCLKNNNKNKKYGGK